VQYAVEVLNVREILVCGHYGCGGVRAVIEGGPPPHGHVERWLAPLRLLANAHSAELMGLESDDLRVARLCEINVLEQVRRLQAVEWVRNKDAVVHGLIYD